jgi:hypothetical protein
VQVLALKIRDAPNAHPQYYYTLKSSEMASTSTKIFIKQVNNSLIISSRF